jgi:hypothetical protein
MDGTDPKYFKEAMTAATDPSLKHLQEKLDQNFLEIILLLGDFFKRDYNKMRAWLYTENLNFGGVEPMRLVAMGRGHVVLNFVKDAEAGNEA